jgi:hypothetical protein
MQRTPRERAARLWWAALAVAAVGIVVAAGGALLPAGGAVLAVVAPLLFVLAVLVGAVAVNLTTRRPELVWTVAGILVFWVANSALYLRLVATANNTLDDVPSQEVIDLLTTLFVAGTAALVVAVLVSIAGWLVRPGRWNALNGPGGQS